MDTFFLPTFILCLAFGEWRGASMLNDSLE